MKTFYFFLNTITFSIILFVTSCAQQPANFPAEISNANKAFIEAFKNGDMNRVSLMHTDDCKIFPSNSETVSGRYNIETFWNKAREIGLKKIQLATVSTEIHDNIVIEEGQYIFYTNGDIVMDEGKYIATWKKVDSNWLINRYIWTSNSAFSGGHNLQAGYILGLHTLEVTLKEGVTFTQFENFYKEKYIPAFERSFTGIQLYLLKADRGENLGKYGELYLIRSMEERNYFEPEAGSLNNEGLKAWEHMKPTHEKLEEMIEIKRVYTDWVVQ